MNQFSIKTILSSAKLLLKTKEITSYNIDAELILAHTLNQNKNYLITHNDLILSSELLEKFIKLIEERINHKPIAQIIGYKYFWKNKFLVDESTLIPRPESEILIEEILKLFPHQDNHLMFADLGSGSGCLGLSLLEEYQNSIGYLIEQNLDASNMIINNTQILNLESRAKIYNMSWNDFQPLQKLDFIISNPPYINPILKPNIMKDVLDYEPHYALFAEDSGLACYHEIITLASNLLKKNGYLIFEIDENWKGIQYSKHFIQSKMQRDLLGLPRCLVLQKI